MGLSRLSYCMGHSNLHGDRLRAGVKLGHLPLLLAEEKKIMPKTRGGTKLCNCFCCNCAKEQARSVMASTEQNYQNAKKETLAEARFEGDWQYVQCKGIVAGSEELSSPGWMEGCENRHQPGREGRISPEDATSHSHSSMAETSKTPTQYKAEQ